MTKNTIFQASDLNRQGRTVLDSARIGPTRLRDTDGLGIIIAPESDWEESVSRASGMSRILMVATLYLTFRTALEDPDWDLVRNSERLGSWAWLRHLPPEDIPEFADEVHLALLDSFSSKDPESLEQIIEDWRETAMVASDPESRQVFDEPFDPADFTEVTRPGES